MTNFEEYKNEILIEFEVSGGNMALTNLSTRHGFPNFFCSFVEWGYQEYVEPYKLTQFEKDVLEKLNNGYIYIFKNGQTDKVMLKESKDCYALTLSEVFPIISYDCLEWDKDYRIADILANCEVINND